jgi:hypothetical protein
VISEGERDKVPMLFIGEKVRRAGVEQWRAHDCGHRGGSAGGHQPVLQRAPAPSPCWQRPKTAVCCTRPIATWKRS